MKRSLNKQIVVRTAVDLINEAGSVEAVKLADIARRLKVRVPSLYNHIRGAADLRRALTRYALRELLAQFKAALGGKVGREGLMAVAHAYRAFAQANPGTYPLVLAAVDPADSELVALSSELVQILTLLFASYGIRDEAAIHAVRGLRSVVHGFVSLEAAGGFKMPVPIDESFEQLLAIFLDGLQK